MAECKRMVINEGVTKQLLRTLNKDLYLNHGDRPTLAFLRDHGCAVY